MKNIYFSIFALSVILFLSACDKNNVNSDLALIEAIANSSNKIEIEEADLLTQTKTILANDYTESYAEKVLFADGLGYEIERRRDKGSLIGERVLSYFDKKGKELNKYKSKDENELIDVEAKDKNECFDFVYPISLTMPDGNAISGADKEELANNLKAWYMDNPTVLEKPSIQFPINVLFEDGTIKPIESKEDLLATIKYCKGEKKFECFTFVYPISYELPDATIVTGADKKDLSLQIKDWYINNPNTNDKGQLVYPIEIKLKDGNFYTLANDAALIVAFEVCKE